MTARNILAAGLLAAACLPSPQGRASELGNLFGAPPMEERSRQVSAQALEGIASVFTALQSREMRRFGDSRERLSVAARMLGDSAAEMRKIEIPESLNRPLRSIIPPTRPQDVPVIGQIAQLLIHPMPEDLRGLYSLFAQATGMLAQRVADQARAPDTASVLTAIGPSLRAVLTLGEIVTRAGQMASR